MTSRTGSTVPSSGAVPSSTVPSSNTVPQERPDHAAQGDGQHSQRRSISLEVSGMTCASCVRRVETALNKLDGVASARVNLATESAEVLAEPGAVLDDRELISAVHTSGYEAVIAPPSSGMARGAAERRKRRSDKLARQRTILAVGAAMSSGVLVAAYGFPSSTWSPWSQLALAFVVWTVVGWMFHRGALRALAHGSVNMDTLVSLGSTVAIGYSIAAVVALPGKPLYFDVAALIVTLIAVGKYLELAARGRAGNAIEALAGLQPETAHLLARAAHVNATSVTAATDGLELTGSSDVAAASLRPGDLVAILPGERIPSDGVLLDSAAVVDESMLTGESMPVEKHQGDILTGGTVNGLSPVVEQISTVGEDTTLARILDLVAQAQAEKSAAQRLADKVSSVFVPMILAVAGITFIGWLTTGHSLVQALVPAIAVMIVACPCALGLATPVAVMAGTGRGAELGLLVKGGEALERIKAIGAVIVDKTGTLTLGMPEVTDVKALPAPLSPPAPGPTTAPPAPGPTGMEAASLPHLLAAAASVEALSEHPLAHAVSAKAASMELAISPVSDVEAVPGGGISGTVDGERIRVGSLSWLAEMGIDVSPGTKAAEDLVRHGRTPLGVVVDDSIRLVIGVADPIRPEAPVGVQRLTDLGIEVVLASGDDHRITAAVARDVGIRQVYAPMRPEEKAAIVAELRKDYGQVAMVGDGINDAPALAAADVGIAIGTGTGAAMAAADITLVHGDIAAVADAIALSRATRRIIWQNLGWAFAYNSAMVPLAAVGILPPIFSALAMALSSVSVVANALRLRHFGQSPNHAVTRGAAQS